MSTLYIVATPIGNLEDLSRRAERILREVDIIVCEDTRVTKKLLDRYEIQKQLISYHVQSPEMRMKEIIDLLCSGKNMALVSDAGTPSINDPGGKLVERVFRELADNVKIMAIPGPSTVAAALSISGFPADRFVYLGFPPHKKGREKFFKALHDIPDTIVFLESPYRIMKALKSMTELIPARSIMVGRELTKIYETTHRGTPREVTNMLKSDTIKGEFVVVIRAQKNPA